MNPALVHQYHNIYIPAYLQMIVTIFYRGNKRTGFQLEMRAKSYRIL